MNDKQDQEPMGVLFGILAYNNIDEYTQFVESIRTGNKDTMLLTIHSAFRYAQTKGVFSLEESETLSITLRNLETIFKSTT